MSLLKKFGSGLLLSAGGALAGSFVFGILLVLGMGESRTGIEKSTSPVFALLGAAVIGFFANKVNLPKTGVAGFWIAFLAMGSLMVWGSSGGQDLGPAGDGFHRDLERWQAFAAVFGCFLAGLVIRLGAIPGIKWLARAR